MLFHRPGNADIPAVIDKLLELLKRPASVHAAHLALALASRHAPSEVSRVKEVVRESVVRLLLAATAVKEQAIMTEQDLVDPADESYGDFTQVFCDNGGDFKGRIIEAFNALKPLVGLAHQGNSWEAELDKEVGHMQADLGCRSLLLPHASITRVSDALLRCTPQVPSAPKPATKAGKAGKGKPAQASAVPDGAPQDSAATSSKKHKDELNRLLEFVQHKLSKIPQVSPNTCLGWGLVPLVLGLPPGPLNESGSQVHLGLVELWQYAQGKTSGSVLICLLRLGPVCLLCAYQL
jgi:hypothetical protein